MKTTRYNLLLAGLLLAAGVYWSRGLGYGLPTKDRILSVNTDETTFLEGLALMNPKRGDFNPNSLHQPHGYFFLLGMAVQTGAWAGAYKLIPDKNYYRYHVDEWRRFYLAGRWMQVLFGLGTLILLYALGRRLVGPNVGLAAAFLFALTPGAAGAVHFSQANIPVTFFGTLALFLCVRVAQGGGLWTSAAAGIATGLAFSVKYSAAPLFVVLAAAHLLRAGSWRGLFSRGALLSFALTTVGFALLSPAAVLDARAYWGDLFGRFLWTSTSTHGVDAAWFRPFFPLVWPLHDALGALLLAASLGGLFFLYREEGVGGRVVLLWIALFYLGLMKAGRVASPPRALIVAPALCLSAVFFFRRFWPAPWGKALALIAAVNALFLSAVLTRHYVRNDLVQEQSTRWMAAHLPANAVVAAPLDPYWYSPDAMILARDHPGQLATPVSLLVLNYDGRRLGEEKPPYLVMAAKERAEVPPLFTDRHAPGFFERLDMEYGPIENFRVDPLTAFWFRLSRKPWYHSNLIWEEDVTVYARRDLATVLK